MFAFSIILKICNCNSSATHPSPAGICSVAGLPAETGARCGRATHPAAAAGTCRLVRALGASVRLASAERGRQTRRWEPRYQEEQR